KDSERGWEVVKSIRTVAAFFWMVNEAACAKYIARRGNYLFSRAYSYYYFMVIKPHEGDSSDPMYQCFAWMMNAKDKARWQTEYESRMAEAESGTGDSTESDDRRVP
ncbi:MAG TPA: hypothetical protein VK956_12380, partial [Verrucomicrobium sp.]|nr:hypothetical protein [Verrucomicrobium sp.]